MSAYIVDRKDIDRLVYAALNASPNYHGNDRKLSWWDVDEKGGYVGWHAVHENAEYMLGAGSRAFVTPSAAGEMLVSENVKSVEYRYPDTARDRGDMPGPIDAYYMGPYVYTEPREQLTPGMVFALIDRLDYQSCEHPGWTTSEAYAFLTSLRQAWCRQVTDAEEAAKGSAIA